MKPLIFAVFLLTSTIAYAYTDDQLADAIYKAEGGAKTKYPYGIVSIKTNGDVAYARQICLNTIRNNRKRFANQCKYTDFIEFLGSKYCPIDCDNDNGTNQYWIHNVKFFLEADN